MPKFFVNWIIANLGTADPISYSAIFRLTSSYKPAVNTSKQGKIHWRKQNITEGIISANPGTNSGSFYESGVFWSKDGNTIEAFSYTFLEACNLIINLVVYQRIPCSYLESEGRNILTLHRTWGSPPFPFLVAHERPIISVD